MLPRLTEQYHHGWYHREGQATAEGQVQSDLSAKEQSFVTSVEAFLADRLPLTLSDDGIGSFIRALSEQGWSAPQWPRRWGGGGLSPREAWLLDRTLGLHGAPLLDPGLVDVIGPLLMILADRELLDRWLPAIARGESRWAVHSSLEGGDPVAGALVADRFHPSQSSLNLRGGVGAQRLILLATDGSAVDLVSAELTPHALIPGAFLDPDQVDTRGLTFVRLEVKRSATQLGTLVRNLNSGEGARARTDGRGRGRSPTGRLRFQLGALRAQMEVTQSVSSTALAELSVALLALEVLEHRAQNSGNETLHQVLAIRGAELGRQLLELTIEALGYYALPAPDPGLQHNELPVLAMTGQDAIGQLIRYVGGLEAMASRDGLFSTGTGAVSQMRPDKGP